MINLIIKDIMMIKQMKIWFFLLLYSFFVVINDNAFGSIFFVIFSIYILIGSLFAYDYKYNGDKFMNSLPVNRKNVIIARYILVNIALILTLLIIFIFRIILLIFFKHTSNLFIDNVWFIILATNLYFGIMIPLIYKYGYPKTKWMNVIGFAVVSGAFAGLLEIKGNLFANNIFEVFICILLSAIIAIISVKISINIYNSKDF